MTDTNNAAISMGDLFAALGYGDSAPSSSASSASTGSSKNASAAAADKGDDVLAELFDLVGDSAVAAKRGGSSVESEPELDLFAALNIDTSPTSEKNQATYQEEYEARLNERENQLREQQIRSQQWQRELKEREERLRRAEQARIEDAEEKIRREQEAAAARGDEAQERSQQLHGSAVEIQSLPDEQVARAASGSGVEPVADARHSQVAEVQHATEQARLQAEAQERAAAAEREAIMRAQAQAEAEAAAAEQARLQAEVAAQAKAQAEAAAAAQAQTQAEAAAAAQAQTQAETKAEESTARAEIERRAVIGTELTSQPTQVIKPLSVTSSAQTEAEATVPVQKDAPSAVDVPVTTPLQEQPPAPKVTEEVAAMAAVESALQQPTEVAAQATQTLASLEKTQPKEETASAAEQTASEAWERKQEPVKRIEQKKPEEFRPEPTKRTGETKQQKIQPLSITKDTTAEERPDSSVEQYAEPGAGSRLGNVVGVILIIFAFVCAALTISLFSGTINEDIFAISKGIFAINNSPAEQQMPAEQESSGSVEANNQATYSYVMRGLNGETHEAIEVATFGEDGKLQESDIEITVPDQATADALLAQLKEEFGNNVVTSSASEYKVNIVVAVQNSDIDKDAYTELLASTMTNFKELNQ